MAFSDRDWPAIVSTLQLGSNIDTFCHADRLDSNRRFPSKANKACNIPKLHGRVETPAERALLRRLQSPSSHSCQPGPSKRHSDNAACQRMDGKKSDQIQSSASDPPGAGESSNLGSQQTTTPLSAKARYLLTSDRLHVADERSSAVQTAVQNHAHRPKIRFGVELPTQQHLRRHVQKTAAQSDGFVLNGKRPREAEIAQLQHRIWLFASDENVLRFQIEMTNGLRPQILQRTGQLSDQLLDPKKSRPIPQCADVSTFSTTKFQQSNCLPIPCSEQFAVSKCTLPLHNYLATIHRLSELCSNVLCRRSRKNHCLNIRLKRNPLAVVSLFPF
ncbi:hypothetical protein Tsp_04893 [Trichinella spiralis]|uniref:hypothetical protein n=1 Tax=Trichinella spiralis TaxID=6334 RepID=UPI0001EFE39A|nr:hypothetical protein Tsp_04893 [Trichinella spiralis]